MRVKGLIVALALPRALAQPSGMNGTCSHGDDAPISEATLSASLKRAEEVAAKEGEKWTPSRARVYELLLRAGGPVKAYDLMPAYAADKTTKPPTVYRALEFLEGLGLAHRIASLSAFMACNDGGPTHAASFLICTCCGSAEEVTPDLAPIIARAGVRRGFETHAATLEIRGLCRRCHG